MSLAVNKLAGFEPSLRLDWDRLAAQSGRRHAQADWSWRKPWWDHFGKDAAPLLIQVRDSDRARLILPLMAKRQFAQGLPVMTAHFIGGWLADYNYPLCDPEDREALAAAFSFLKKDRAWTVMDLFNLDPTAEKQIAPAAREAGLAAISRPLVDCRVIRLNGTFSDYWQGLSRNTRRELTKKQNRFESAAKLSFSAILDPAAMEQNLEVMAELNRKRWALEKGGHSLFDNRQVKDFVFEMAPAMAEMGKAALFFLFADEKPAAYHFGQYHERNDLLLTLWTAWTLAD